MKMQQSPYFLKSLEVEGYVLPEEWVQIVEFFNNRWDRFNSLDLSKIKNVSIPKAVFANNANLQEVVLPEGLVTIEKSAFENCISLKKVIFSDNIKAIEENAFANCNLEYFYMPKALEFLGDNAFKNNYKLQNFNLEKELEFMGKDVFLYDKNFVKTVPFNKNIKNDLLNEKER